MHLIFIILLLVPIVLLMLIRCQWEFAFSREGDAPAAHVSYQSTWASWPQWIALRDERIPAI